MIDIIIFAVITAFIVVKLFQVLGDKRYETPKELKTAKSTPEAKVIEGEVVPVPVSDKLKQAPVYDEVAEQQNIQLYGNDNWQQIKEIQKYDYHFTPESFLNGAQGAFEMILNAYTKVDKNTLRELVSPEIYKRLTNAIDKMSAEGEIQHNTLVSIVSAEIVKVELDKKTALITVDFITDQVNLMKDKTGKLLEGDPSQIDRIADRWVFSRVVTASDPNWLLVRTQKK